MAILEKQFETWSHQGSITQSASTYQAVRNALERVDAPYCTQSYSIFLQGSYSNSTNIYADSDVDIVILLDSLYYYDTSQLSATELASFNRNSSKAGYSWASFRRETIQNLTSIYGKSVHLGNKAIFIAGAGDRRDVDVLPAAEYRQYFNYSHESDQKYAEGICLWLPNGTQIVNYPKQHAENCTRKHKRTSSWFKPMVRIVKNMRNIMVDRGNIPAHIAPSYFVEGMLYNIPDHHFGHSYSESFVAGMNWLLTCNREALVCANELYMLVHPASPVTWRIESLNAFLDALVDFWNRSG